LSFTGPLEAETRRRLGCRLLVDARPGMLLYTVHALRHPGDPRGHTVTVKFEAAPLSSTFGLHPSEFPRVYADPGAVSPHRHEDEALCLWMPLDPVDKRWTPDKGLHDLLGLAVRHLFAEHWWREHDQRWLLEEAPHGLPSPRPASEPRTRDRTIRARR
jgi:hypothetical protein